MILGAEFLRSQLHAVNGSLIPVFARTTAEEAAISIESCKTYIFLLEIIVDKNCSALLSV